MRRLSFRLPLRLSLLGVLFSAGSLRADDTQAPTSPPKGEVCKHSFEQSRIFPGTARDYWIYVPKQYDPAKPACLYVNQDGVQYRAPEVFDQLIAKVANVCFGGADFQTLFAMCGERVYKRKLKVKGANAYEPPIKPGAPRI